MDSKNTVYRILHMYVQFLVFPSFFAHSADLSRQENILSGNSHHWITAKWFFRHSVASPISIIILPTSTFVADFAAQFIPRLHAQFNSPLHIVSLTSTTVASENEEPYDCENCRDMHFGYMLIAESVSVLLDSFDAIQLSQMVWNPRSRFLVLLAVSGDCSMPLYDLLLAEMWTRYHILHALVMTIYAETCETSYHSDVVSGKASRPQETKVTFYDPFHRNEDGSWGRVRFFQAEALDLYKGLVMKKLRKDLKRYPVRAIMFERISSAILESGTNDSYYGVDGHCLQELGRFMNVNMKVREPSDNKMFGYRDNNGTFKGAIGDVVNGKADISFNSRFIKDYGTDGVIFTHHLDVDDVCIVVPKAARMPQWLVMASCYSKVIYFLLGMSYLTFVALIYNFKKLRNHVRNEQNPIDIANLFLDAFRPFISMSIFNRPVVNSERILSAVFIATGTLICFIFQGSLVKLISHPLFYTDINTLQELDASGLNIRSGSQALDDALFPGDPVMARLAARVDHLYGGVLGPERVANSGNIAAFIRRSDLNARIPPFRAADGMPKLHLMRECPKMYYLAFIVPRLSPYLAQFNYVIQYIFESGLVQKWERMAKDRLVETKRINRTNGFEIPDVRLKVFSVIDLELPFCMLAAGLAASMVVFLCEIKAWTKFCPVSNALS